MRYGPLTQSGLPANRLQLELTESVLVSKPERIISKLQKLRSTGQKIDRAFVQDLGEDMAEEAIVDTILSLGRTLNLKVIAEGVEHIDQLDGLAKLGCRNYQGFYFSRPIATTELVEQFSSVTPTNRDGNAISTSAA